MSGWIVVLLAWIGFSPVLGIALGAFLRRAGELDRTGGDRTLNVRRPDGLPVFVAAQLVPAKASRPYTLSRTS